MLSPLKRVTNCKQVESIGQNPFHLSQLPWARTLHRARRREHGATAPNENTRHQLNRPRVVVRSDTGLRNTPWSQQGVRKHSRFKEVSLTPSSPKGTASGYKPHFKAGALWLSRPVLPIPGAFLPWWGRRRGMRGSKTSAQKRRGQNIHKKNAVGVWHLRPPPQKGEEGGLCSSQGQQEHGSRTFSQVWLQEAGGRGGTGKMRRLRNTDLGSGWGWNPTNAHDTITTTARLTLEPPKAQRLGTHTAWPKDGKLVQTRWYFSVQLIILRVLGPKESTISWAVSFWPWTRSGFPPNLNLTLLSFQCFDSGERTSSSSTLCTHFPIKMYPYFPSQSGRVLSPGCAPSEAPIKIIRFGWWQSFATWKCYLSHAFKHHLFDRVVISKSLSPPLISLIARASESCVQWPTWCVHVAVSKALQNQWHVSIGKRPDCPQPSEYPVLPWHLPLFDAMELLSHPHLLS